MLRVRGTLPLAVALLVAGGAALLFGYSSTLNPIDALLGRGAIVAVPDVEGRALPRARAELDEAGLGIEERSAFSLSVPRGRVIQQDPAPGRRVRQGEVVEVVVSRGANRVEMPDAVGRPLAEVRRPLEDAGVPFEVVEVPSEEVPEGVVVAQDPDPGVMVTGEDEVRFDVSTGPRLRPVPEVIGLSLDAAAFKLGDAGLAPGEVSFVEHDAVPAGAVVATDPPIGTDLERDAPVDLVLSAGRPQVPVPNVTGGTAGRARDRLEALGFLVSTSHRLLAEGAAGVGAVLEQQPAAGEPLRPGEVVRIVVGREPPAPPPTTTTTTAPPPPAQPGGPTPPPNPPPGPGGGP